MKQNIYEGSMGMISYHFNVVTPRSEVDANLYLKDEVPIRRRVNESKLNYSVDMSVYHFELAEECETDY
jgi:hypothetical protein